MVVSFNVKQIFNHSKLIEGTFLFFSYISFIFCMSQFIITLLSDKFPLFYQLQDSFTVLRNWQKKPIIDILPVVNSTCNNGLNSTDYELLDFGYFMGTDKGCDCASKNIIYTYDSTPLTETFSQIYSIINGCDCLEVKPIPPKEINKWNNMQFCAKYYNKTYFELLSNNKIKPMVSTSPNKTNIPSPCPKNFKNCGYIDSLKNILCLPSNEQCPLNNAFIISKQYLSILDIFNNKSFIDLKDGNIFIKSSNDDIYRQNGIILVDLFVKDEDLCADNSTIFYPLFGYYTSTYLCNFYKKSTLDTFEIAFAEDNINSGKNLLISSEAQKYFYKDLNILSDVKSLPFYPSKFLTRKNYNLINRNYFFVNQSCIDIGLPDLKSLNLNLGDLDLNNGRVTTILFEFLSTFLVFKNILFFMNNRKKAIRNYLIIDLFLVLGFNVFILFQNVSNGEKYKYLRIINNIQVNSECFEYDVLDFFLNFQSVFNNLLFNYGFHFALNIHACIFSAFSFFISVYLVYRNYLYTKNSNFVEMSSLKTEESNKSIKINNISY